MMAKAVVDALLATALVLLIIVNFYYRPNHRSRQDHGRIRRLGSETMPPIFDPLMAKVQRIAEAKAPETIQLEEQDKKYFNDDGTLNLRLRLMVLFPILDREPQDGMLEAKELELWLTQQAIDGLHYRTKRELEFHDTDGDGAVSFSEYLPQFTLEDIEENSKEYGEAGWWMEKFRNADADKNGTLNLYEFRDFLHPEDSRNEQIQRWLLTEKIRQMDENYDQRLDFAEFENGAYDTYKTYLEYESSPGDYIPTATEVFTKLDVDKDKLLRVEELKPLLRYLNPGELVHAKYYASFLVQEADSNRDGKLTLDEMLNHEHVFYKTVYDNGKNDDQDLGFHDEL